MRTPEPDRPLPALPRLGDSSLDTILITKESVRRHLKGANTKKAPGSDDLRSHLLKHCAEELSGSLILVFLQCLQSRVWPSQWKETRVTPVNKKLRSELNNYRLTSFLLVISKIFERMIAEQLINFLKDHQLQSPRQFGFRRDRSISDLLLSKSLHDALDASRPSLVIALDVAGVFDCV